MEVYSASFFARILQPTGQFLVCDLVCKSGYIRLQPHFVILLPSPQGHCHRLWFLARNNTYGFHTYPFIISLLYSYQDVMKAAVLALPFLRVSSDAEWEAETWTHSLWLVLWLFSLCHILFHTTVYLASLPGFHILASINIRECIWMSKDSPGKLMSSYLPLSVWFPWDWVEVCSYTEQAICWRDHHPEEVCLNLRRRLAGGSSDWVRMCFVGIFGYILKSFGLMSSWDRQLSPRAQEWMVGPLQSRLWLCGWCGSLGKWSLLLPGIPIVCPL